MSGCLPRFLGPGPGEDGPGCPQIGLVVPDTAANSSVQNPTTSSKFDLGYTQVYPRTNVQDVLEFETDEIAEVWGRDEANLATSLHQSFAK